MKYLAIYLIWPILKFIWAIGIIIMYQVIAYPLTYLILLIWNLDFKISYEYWCEICMFEEDQKYYNYCHTKEDDFDDVISHKVYTTVFHYAFNLK